MDPSATPGVGDVLDVATQGVQLLGVGLGLLIFLCAGLFAVVIWRLR